MKVLLLPCKIRVDRFVPQKGTEAVSFLWSELVAKFAPTATVQATQSLRKLTPGTFVGLKTNGTNFIFRNPDGSNSIAFLLKQDAAFPSKIKEVWRVESVSDNRIGKIDEVT